MLWIAFWDQLLCSNSNNPVANKISFVTFGPGHFEYDWNGEKDASNFPQRVAKEMASKVVTLFIHFEAIQRQLPSGNLNADHIGKQVQRKFKAKKIKTFCNELNGRF